MRALATSVLCLLACLLIAEARPTVYVKNEYDKLEPVLVPVSSTVIPLPVYRVATGLGVQGGPDAAARPPGEHKLLTAGKKKTSSKKGGSPSKVALPKKETYNWAPLVD